MDKNIKNSIYCGKKIDEKQISIDWTNKKDLRIWKTWKV